MKNFTALLLMCFAFDSVRASDEYARYENIEQVVKSDASNERYKVFKMNSLFCIRDSQGAIKNIQFNRNNIDILNNEYYQNPNNKNLCFFWENYDAKNARVILKLKNEPIPFVIEFIR